MWAITSFTCASPAFPEAVVTFTRKNSGLPNDRVVALAPGADGALWVGTEGGLARPDRDGRWQTYRTASSGHLSVRINHFRRSDLNWANLSVAGAPAECLQ